MPELLSVVLPTYNPHPQRLSATLAGLQHQSLPPADWELIIVDNNSDPDVAVHVNLSWHPNARVVKEARQGLTYARVNGFLEATGSIIILVDDDNILDKEYLHNVAAIFKNDAMLGAIGGKSIPSFEKEPPAWLNEFYGNLALRDLGEKILTEAWASVYPASAPIGAGLAMRKQALKSYMAKIKDKNLLTDRVGRSLSSGGDNDIVLEVLKSGWKVGYFPALSLVHMIPKERMEVEYIARLVNNTNRSWVQLLQVHGINPWKMIPGWSVTFRKIKAWFTYKTWLADVNYIRWRGACGTFDGLNRENAPGQL